jgi:two-component system invasion response regulator UvrY
MSAGAPRILLVDDDAGMRRHVRRLLAEDLPGAEIVEVESADDALARVRREAWDVVILDIRLPGRSGLEVLPDLRAARPLLPIIVMSGLPEAPYAGVAARAGASAYLVKEQAPEQLVETIRGLLSRSAA